MKKATQKRKPGRPYAGGKSPLIALRMTRGLIELVDNYCSRQPDRPSRSEAIRRLVLQALAAPKQKE
jgi:hypothetical protein